jgi:hypothetical protein
MQQTLAGLPQHDRRLVREMCRLVDDARRIGAEMDVAAAAGAMACAGMVDLDNGKQTKPIAIPRCCLDSGEPSGVSVDSGDDLSA